MEAHWILVADAARARIFSGDDLLRRLIPVEERIHPAGRLHTSELMSGDRGRSQSMPGGPHTAFEPHTDRSLVEETAFAQELAEAVTDGLDRQQWSRLILVAPPHFLGLLRDALPDRARQRVAAEIHHDITLLGPDKVSSAILQHMQL